MYSTKLNFVKHHSSQQLLAAIAQGPVSVVLDAGNDYFKGYQGGILNDCGNNTNPDHAGAAVGYGTEDGQLYYIVKNQWGLDWGEKGYIRIAVEADKPFPHQNLGLCGI